MSKDSSINEIFLTLGDVWGHLSAQRKKQFYLLGVLMLFGGLAEAVSLGLVVPFLAAMAAPEKVLAHPLFGQILVFFETTGLPISQDNLSKTNLVVMLALLFGVAAVFAGGIRLILLWSSLRLSNGVGTDFSLKVYQTALFQPYAFHVAQNSSTIISLLTGKVGAIKGVLQAFLTLVTSSVVMVATLGTLVVICLGTTFSAVLALFLCYAFLAWGSRRKIAANGHIISTAQTQLIKALQEGLGGIRDILLDGTQAIYSRIYGSAEISLRRAVATNTFIGQSPRFIMEVFGMVLFASLALALSQKPGGVISALPVLGALALGVQRLLPALQQCYVSWATALTCEPSVRGVLQVLNQPLPVWAKCSQPAPLPFHREIRFDRVQFRYPGHGPLVLDNLSFSIPKGSRVGFVGKTGSGKSTCLDLLMGLLEPTSGRILVDGHPLNQSNIRAWQRNIAHVPQAIYLADSTLAENIAFGVAPGKIDMVRVRQAAQQAQIADFIESAPQGYQALVGERGIRLSGGQRQRIGIARALYKQAKVLVFDEATNALDKRTESAVLKEISRLSSDLTILIIAHRLSALRGCSFQVVIEKSTNRSNHVVSSPNSTKTTFLRHSHLKRSPHAR